MLDDMCFAIRRLEEALVTSRETVGWTSVLLSKRLCPLPGRMIWYSPFPMVGECIRSVGLKERIDIRNAKYIFRIITKRGPHHVIGGKQVFDVFGRQTKYSDYLSGSLVCTSVLPGHPTHLGHCCSFTTLYTSLLGERTLIGPIRIVLASHWLGQLCCI